MEFNDTPSPRRGVWKRARHSFPLVLCVFAALLLTARTPSAGTYFMYRDQPLRLMTPRSFAPSPQRSRPFDYRKEYTPQMEFQQERYTKSLPALDLRVKSMLSFPMDFDGFLLDCESSIRAVMTRSRAAADSVSIAPMEAAGPGEPAVGRETDYGGHGGGGFRNPLHRAEFHGPVLLAASGGEMQTAPEDMQFMLARLARAVTRYIPIEAKTDTMTSLDSPGIRNVPFLLLSFMHEPRLSAGEKNHLRLYLRAGGFAFVYCDLPSDPDALLAGLLPGSRPEETLAKPIPPGHPLYHSFFDLPDGTNSGAGSTPPVNQLMGIWMKDRLAAVCLPRAGNLWTERTPEGPELNLWVNLVMFALTQPGGMAVTGTEGAAGPR